MDSSERRLLAESRLIPRSEMWAQAAAERVAELVVSALDMNELLDQVDLNAVLDQVDINRLLGRIDLDRLLSRVDLNDIVQRIDVEALIRQTDLGSVIAASSSGVAGDVLDVVRSQAVGLDEFIARWIGRLRRRPGADRHGHHLAQGRHLGDHRLRRPGVRLLCLFLGDRRRALHDVIAGTAVIYSWDARAARLRFLSRS